MSTPDRRAFLSASALSAGSLAFLDRLPAVAADDAKPDPNLVRIDSGIEPIVRLLEESPREKLLEEVGARIKKGLSYRDVLTALFLAGVRNVPPRPSVGFKFHAVLVVNSAHQAALAGPDSERWLPIFWALDNFKSAQAQMQNEKDTRGWRMKPVDDAKVPSPSKARDAFTAAMDNWDAEAADTATAGAARALPVNELFDLFAKYGSRDFRDIGHKAIYVANAFRTLDVIGWQHAEPILRSLSFALVHHEGENPSKRDGEPDRSGRKNLERIRSAVPQRGIRNHAAPEATGELIQSLRTATADEIGEQVGKLIAARVSTQPLWDGLFLGAGELLMRQPGIVGLHTLTTLNALHYAARTTGNEETRKLLLLQAASFLPQFRAAMIARGKLSDAKIDKLEPRENDAEFTVRHVYSELSRSKETAARTALTVLNGNPAKAKELIDTGRRLIYLKGTDSHDYKFSASVMEDAAFIAPEWRNRFLAASMFWLKGSEAPDAPLVKRTRAALV